MLAIAGGSVFLAPITIGGQEFNVVIDTGSSDPWIATKDFECYDRYTGEALEEAACYFGPVYDPSTSPTYRNYPQRTLNLSYHDGETLNGHMGYETFTMGGIRVDDQIFGKVDYAAWNGDGVSSGLVGFAYRTLTSMYIGDDPKKAVPGRAVNYDTLFDSMWRSNLTDPVFSMALTRDLMLTGMGGLMALGGIPNIPFGPTWISVPLVPVSINPVVKYQFYTILVDGWALSADPSAQFASVVNAKENPRKTPLKGPSTSDNHNNTVVTAIVDSGTTLVYVDDELALETAQAFDPPGALNPDTELFEVPCNSKPPDFGVSINGKIFLVNPDDMFLQTGPDTCISGVQGNHGPGGLWILGDVWMKSVLCVFDVGSGWMRFAGRQYYGLTWNE
ncbi:hypothetical protein Q7P37_000736 [Cladosporium fusiforme]